MFAMHRIAPITLQDSAENAKGYITVADSTNVKIGKLTKRFASMHPYLRMSFGLMCAMHLIVSIELRVNANDAKRCIIVAESI